MIENDTWNYFLPSPFCLPETALRALPVWMTTTDWHKRKHSARPWNALMLKKICWRDLSIAICHKRSLLSYPKMPLRRAIYIPDVTLLLIYIPLLPSYAQKCLGMFPESFQWLIQYLSLVSGFMVLLWLFSLILYFKTTVHDIWGLIIPREQN